MKEPHVLTIFIESKNFRFFSNFQKMRLFVKNICVLVICTGVDVEIFVNI